MTARSRFLSLALIMILACAVTMVVMMSILLRHELRKHQEMLRVSVKSQTLWVESILRSQTEEGVDYEVLEEALKQEFAAHEDHLGFGISGELAVVRRNGRSIDFILRHEHDEGEDPKSLAFDSDRVEPMRRALNGESGIFKGLGCQGQGILAAYEPITALNLGVVAQINLGEIRAPFIKACLSASVATFFIILAGMVLFFRVGDPLLARLKGYAQELEEELDVRKKAEEAVYEQMRRDQVFLNAFPCVALLMRSETYEVVALNTAAKEAGCSVGQTCFSSWPKFDQPCPWCLAPEAWTTGEQQHKEFETNGVAWDAHWIPVSDDLYLHYAFDITERKLAEKELDRHRLHLEDLVKERTVQLDMHITDAEDINRAMVNVMEDLQASNMNLGIRGRELTESNKELDAFSYSVSHDLRAPLRHVGGFVQLLLKREQGRMDATSVRYLAAISESSIRMGQLIDDLLVLSRTGRTEVHLCKVDSSAVVREVLKELSPETEPLRITWKIGELPFVEADRGLLRQVWDNLIGNAIKYSSHCENALIEIGTIHEENEVGAEGITFFIRDNGVGFDPQYTHKLFGVFQRLHRDDEFEGTGIGLAIVQRIIHRHGGRVWAEGKVGSGATFYFTLNAKRGEA